MRRSLPVIRKYYINCVSARLMLVIAKNVHINERPKY